MKFHLTYKTLDRLCVMLGFFLICVSYTKWLMDKPPATASKYLGISLLMYVMIFKDMLFNKTIRRSHVAYVFYITTVFTVLAFIQSNLFSNLLLSFFYGIVISSITMFAYKIFSTAEAFLDIAIGCMASILVAAATTSGAFEKVNAYGRTRVNGGFSHPNTFGAIMLSIVCCLVLYLMFTLKEKNYIRKLFCLAGIAVIEYFIILSDSRNSLVGSIIITIMIVGMEFLRRVKTSPAVKAVMIFIFILLCGYVLIRNFNSDTQDSLWGRVYSMRYIKSFPTKNLLFGYGLSLRHLVDSGGEFSITQIIAKTGIFGMIIYTAILGRIYLRSTGIVRIQRSYFIAAAVTFLACSIPEAFIPNITNTFAMCMWIVVSAMSDPRVELFAPFEQNVKDEEEQQVEELEGEPIVNERITN